MKRTNSQIEHYRFHHRHLVKKLNTTREMFCSCSTDHISCFITYLVYIDRQVISIMKSLESWLTCQFHWRVTLCRYSVACECWLGSFVEGAPVPHHLSVAGATWNEGGGGGGGHGKGGRRTSDVRASGREGLEYYIMSRKIIAVSRTSNTCQILAPLAKNLAGTDLALLANRRWVWI